MAKLWTSEKSKIDAHIEEYCFSEDVALDAKLVRYDTLGSLAHARMLRKIQILEENEYLDLKKKLIALLKSYEQGDWKIEISDEDVHTAVESKLGEAGSKLHTARSRNDQVLTDMRLYGKDQVLNVALCVLELSRNMSENAKKYEFTPMPGYTHLQRAMPMSYGMWMGAHSEALLGTLEELALAYSLMDQNPLGSGAGFGVSLPIDRELTSELLGFSKVQKNSLYCQNSRGHFEAVVLCSLSSVMSVLSRMSADICLFCSQEFSFLNLPDGVVTGSSIMPQKKNPDIFELIRAKSSRMLSLEMRIRTVTQGVTSGYSKDLQEVKAPFMEAFDCALGTLKVLIPFVGDIQPNEKNCLKAMTTEIYAADRAYELVQEGVPFRKAYLQVKEDLKTIKNVDWAKCIRNRTHVGSTGNLELEKLSESIQKIKSEWDSRRENLDLAWESLLAE